MAEDDEIIRADPARRRRAMLASAAIFAAIALIYLLVGNPFDPLFDRYARELEELAETDAAQARRESGNLFIAIVVAGWLFALLSAVFGVVLGSRMWRASQWPLPDARLIADTRVVRGARLRVRAALTMGLPLAFFIPITYYALEVVVWIRERL